MTIRLHTPNEQKFADHWKAKAKRIKSASRKARAFIMLYQAADLRPFVSAADFSLIKNAADGNVSEAAMVYLENLSTADVNTVF